MAGIAGILLWRRRRNADSNTHAPVEAYSELGHHSGQTAVNELASSTPPVEKYAHNGYGYPRQEYVAEAPADSNLVEMPANPVQR